MKARTMIYLEPAQLTALRARARAEGVSLAGLFRRLVRDYLSGQHTGPEVPIAEHARMIGLGSSGRRDISERHDAYLGEAIGPRDAG